MNLRKKRIAFYCRYASDKHLDEQMMNFLELSAIHKIQTSKAMYFEDKALGSREGLAKMYANAMNQNFDVLIINSYHVIDLDIFNYFNVEKDLKKLGIEIIHYYPILGRELHDQI